MSAAARRRRSGRRISSAASGLRLAGLALWGGAIAFMISPASMAWSALPLPAEEEKLLARFGEPYRDYQARTGRFLPRMS